MTLRGLKRGTTAAQRGIEVATSWDDFVAEPYDGSEDGDDSVHHGLLAHHVPAHLLSLHLEEQET